MDWLDKFQNSQKALRCLIHQIDRRARAFAETGNTYMAVIMDGWVEALDEIETQNNKAISEQTSEYLRSAQQSSTNLLNGVLAGIELGQKEK